MDAFVEVVQPDGTQERFPIEGAQATVGKSGTAAISIPTASELELEHLLIAPRGKEGCWVSTSQGALTPTMLKGKPFTSGMVPWGSEFAIGKLRIRVTNKRASVKKEGQVSPVILLAAVVVIALAAYVFLQGGTESLPSAEGIEPPELFTNLAGSCPEGGDPGTQAQQIEYRAHSRGDRYRYNLRDGVQAVQLYDQAAACYRSDGNTSQAEEMVRQRDEMKDTIESDYAARRLRLHHALQTEDWESASVETRSLAQLTSHLEGDDAYVTWLERTRRIVQARYDRMRESR